MKKRALLLVVTAMALFSAACSSPADELKKDYHVPSNTGDVTSSISSEAAPVEIPEPDNATPYQELLTKEIDIHSFMEKYCLRDPYGSGEIEDIAADIGIECLRETEAGALYSIHKVRQGGLLYVFYMNNLPTAPDHHPVIRCMYMQKKLSSKDFESIKEGSMLTEVKKIDSIAQIYENMYYSDPEYWESTGGCGSIHYLSDGILEIGFKERDGKLKVFASKLTEDFDMPQFTGKNYPYNGRILDTDWTE